jgi:hypothetical protein
MAHVNDVLPITNDDPEFVIGRRLCNFETGKSYLLTNHQNRLDTDIQPKIRVLATPWINLIGYASRLNRGHINQEKLSYDRCEAVKRWVDNYADRISYPIEWPKGDTESTGPLSNNDGYWRAVEICVYSKKPVKPPQPKPKPRPVLLSREWAIKFVSGGSIGVVAGIESALFEIADTRNNIYMKYTYSGAIIAGGVHDFMPFSVSGEGSWRRFPTSTEIHVSDFEGPARMTEAGAGPISYNLLTMTPKGGAVTIPQTLDISTGFTGGAGASLTIPKTGWMRLESRHPLTYYGDLDAIP